MQKFYKPSRIALLFVFVGLLLAVYMTALYRLQLFDTGAEANAYFTRDTTSKKVTLTANRGDILDRNGEYLITTRAAYNVSLSRDAFKGRDDINEVILKLVHTAIDNGVNYNDSFPVTQGAPFSYVLNMTDKQKNRLDKYLDYFDYFDIGPDITASELIVKMKEHYKIDYTMNITDARLVIGIRYELELRPVLGLDPYMFANDIDTDFIMLLQELHFPGVSIETSAVRVYHTTYAAHLLGYTGSMSKNEYDTIYKPLGYSYNSQVGKDGAEAAFESYLHGTDGEQRIITGADGTIISVETTKEPAPGDNIFLSIDIGLQAVCEDSLTAKIDEINTDREDKDRVTGGAIVAVDVNTGEVLACASYPTYDPSTLAVTIGDLVNNPTRPMYDRATMGLYKPGSTFKMVTALAGFKDKAIDLTTTFKCTGLFMKYVDVAFTPRCWIYPQGVHGDENVIGALRDSCDYFFYSLGDIIGIRSIANTAADFGFGEKTGIELPEKAGTLPTEENKIKLIGETWFKADTIHAAIGQSICDFTPVQLANYVATIANGGSLYTLTMLSNIRSADFTTVLDKPEPEIRRVIEGSQEYLQYIQQGMRAVCTSGTAKNIFKDYAIPVAAKTGTVQLQQTMGNEALNTGVFVCYAPYDKPEIAVAIVVEKGTSGSTIANISKDIFDYYFSSTPDAAVAKDNALLP